jgi:ABC-type multidrug transport system fused ATPase/permease subunit
VFDQAFYVRNRAPPRTVTRAFFNPARRNLRKDRRETTFLGILQARLASFPCGAYKPSIITLVQQLWTVLDRRSRIQSFFLLILMTFGGILELVGLLLLPVLVMLLSAPELLRAKLAEHHLAQWMPAENLDEHLTAFLAFMAGFFLVKNLFLSGLVNIQTRFQIGVQTRLAHRVLAGFLRAPYERHLSSNSAQHLHLILADLPRMFNSLVGPLFTLASESIVFTLLGATLFIANPLSFVVAILVIGGASTIFYMLLRKRITVIGAAQTRHGKEVAQAASQSLSGIKDIKILACEDYFLGKFDSNALAYATNMRRGASYTLYPKYFLETVALLAIVLMTWLMQAQGKPTAVILNQISLFAIAAIRLIPSLNRILNAANHMLNARPVLREICSTLERFSADTPKKPVPGTALGFSHAVELAGVSYHYPNGSRAAADHLQLVINRGTTTAFVGPSGAGKSTIADLLLGLLPPRSGKILADGKDIQENPGAWRKKIGYIPQFIYLADDTIRRNIAFGVPDDQIDEKALEEAVSIAQLKSLMTELPEGLNQTVGERGVRLSGGQRQRIGIARALYRRPEILLMDEATSALDNQTEREITSILNRLHSQKTIILIAHRLSTVQHADKIVFLQEGRILAEGSYNHLYETCPAFTAMVKAGELPSASEDPA